MEDHIVEEVRRVRDEHAARFNYNLDAIVADLKRSEAEREWPRASFAPRRIQRLVPADVTAVPFTPGE
jgi:hypothetical protein